MGNGYVGRLQKRLSIEKRSHSRVILAWMFIAIVLLPAYRTTTYIGPMTIQVFAYISFKFAVWYTMKLQQPVSHRNAQLPEPDANLTSSILFGPQLWSRMEAPGRKHPADKGTVASARCIDGRHADCAAESRVAVADAYYIVMTVLNSKKSQCSG
ncbi:hypothetical protein ACQKWADRAFT_286461 [Trichoderma austrokoningii]